MLSKAPAPAPSAYCWSVRAISIWVSTLRVETALNKISNDILLAADSELLSILILLDLSAAFDISHSVMLHRLETIGITGTPLTWFHSWVVLNLYS